MCISYTFTAGDQVQAIESGIDDLARASCVKFRPYKKGDRDAVVIQVPVYQLIMFSSFSFLTMTLVLCV